MVPEGTYNVDPSVIRRSSKEAGEYPNYWSNLLEKADVFERQGLTPVYIYDPILRIIELSTEEKLLKKVH